MSMLYRRVLPAAARTYKKRETIQCLVPVYNPPSWRENVGRS